MEKQVIEYFLDRSHDTYKGHEIVSLITDMCKPKRRTLNISFLSQSDIEKILLIIKAVENATGINFDSFNARDRRKDLSVARFLFMHLVHKEMGLTLTTVGRIMNGRDHTTVINANKVVESWLELPYVYKREKQLIDDTRKYLATSLQGQE